MSDLTEDQQAAKDDIQAVRRQIKMMRAFESHRSRNWILCLDKDTGDLKLFEGRDEVVFNSSGCYVLPGDRDQGLESGKQTGR